MTDDLIAWLRAQLDDDERAARAWLPLGNPTAADREHIARHDPARVLAEVDADRAILAAYEEAEAYYRANPSAPAGELHGLLTAIKHRATVFADREGYRDEVRP